jgi:hypothetical protein
MPATKPPAFMKSLILFRQIPRWLSVLVVIAAPQVAHAFPPAPHHVIFGMVRDDFGTPMTSSQVQVILETPTGTQLATKLVAFSGPGVNYQLEVPMDSGIAPDPYEPAALQIAARFKMVVVVGTVTNLPIQMTGDFSRLGQPGQQTRIDLTLGADVNGNGIPDAWELAYLAALHSNLTLADLTANSIIGPDGLTLLQEFLAGYYPFDPAESFRLQLIDANHGAPILQFTAITGRSYTVLGSADMQTWTPLPFVIPAEGSNGSTHSYYSAQDVRTLQVQVLQPLSGPEMHYFRLVLQ